MQKKENFSIKRMPVSDQVFNKLRDAINDGEWPIGCKIPSEMEFSSLFGVNRLTVRLAIQRLIEMGLLESRVGDGTYVKKFSFRDYVGKASDFFINPDNYDDVLEYRYAIESTSLRLAILRASDEEIASLGAICDEMDQIKDSYIIKNDPAFLDDFLKLDLAFHEKICYLAHNNLFVYAFDIVRNTIQKYMQSLLLIRAKAWVRNASNNTNKPDKHRCVYLALKERNQEKCLSEYNAIIDYKVKY